MIGGVGAAPVHGGEEVAALEGDRGYTVLEVDGALDAATANAVLHRLLGAIRVHGPHLVVDLSRVDEVDAAGVGVLLAAHHQAQVLGGDLRLAGGPSTVCRLTAELTTHPLVIAADVADAITAPPHPLPAHTAGPQPGVPPR